MTLGHRLGAVTGWRRSLLAGLLYWLVVFALGFALGTLRVLLVEPRIGLANATLVELPLMLVASWAICRWLVRRLAVPPALADRLTMGLVAFGLLMLAELAVSLVLFGRTPTEHLATYGEAARQWGLAAQVAFAAFPLLKR